MVVVGLDCDNGTTSTYSTLRTDGSTVPVAVREGVDARTRGDGWRFELAKLPP